MSQPCTCTCEEVKCSCYKPGVAQRVGRGIALLFLDHGSRRSWVVSSTPRPHFTTGKDPVPILQETGWAPGPVWMGRKFCPHWDSILDLPVHSQSLYQLSHPADTCTCTTQNSSIFECMLFCSSLQKHRMTYYSQIIHSMNSRISSKKGQQGMLTVWDAAASLLVRNAKSASQVTSVAQRIFVLPAVRMCLLYALH